MNAVKNNKLFGVQDGDVDWQEEGAGYDRLAVPHPPPLAEPGSEAMITISNNKFVTDNLNLMCEFECLLCGAGLKVSRRILFLAYV